MCYTHRPPQLGTYHVAFVIPCVLYIIVSFMPRLLYCVSSVCQVELAILVNVGVRVDSARASPLTGLVRSLRIGTVSLNSSLSLWTQQGCFAATVCPVWKQTASAVRLSAGNTEDSVAACAPAVRFVCVLLFSSCALASGMACLSKHAVSLVPYLGNGGQVAGTHSPTSRLASVWQENVHYYSAPKRRQIWRAVVELLLVTTVDARCVRDEEVCLTLMFYWSGLGKDIVCFIAWLWSRAMLQGNKLMLEYHHIFV